MLGGNNSPHIQSADFSRAEFEFIGGRKKGHNPK
jgi:hypothetical protein